MVIHRPSVLAFWVVLVWLVVALLATGFGQSEPRPEHFEDGSVRWPDGTSECLYPEAGCTP